MYLSRKYDCLNQLCNFVTILNDLEYFNSGTLPKKVNFRTDFLRFSQNKTVQENLNRSGLAENRISECLI